MLESSPKIHENFKQGISKGEFGKIAKLCLKFSDLLRLQHQGPAAIQMNVLEIRLDAWERILPYQFIFNKINYARYGSYYIHVLKHIQSKYHGLKELLLPCGLSVQAQETQPVRIAIYQRGEQIINKGANTSGM